MKIEEFYLLQNIGIPGLVLLLCVFALLYLLIRNFNKYSIVGEASRTKYIAIWFFVGFVGNLFATIWSEVWVVSYPQSLQSPPDNLLLFFCYYAISLVVIYFFFTFIHSFFTSITRNKIIPYIWFGSILGGMVSIGQFSAFEISSLYPDFFSYNASAVVLSQLIYIGLISRWIRKNPGFDPAVSTRDAVNINRKEPKVSSTSVSKDKTDTDQNQTKTDQSKFLSGTSNVVEGFKYQEPPQSVNPKEEIQRADTLSKLTTEGSDFLNEPNLEISLGESSEILRQELCEFLYVASKFGDVEEILNLLLQLGFQVNQDQFHFIIKDNNGLKRVIDGDKNLISFAKRLSLQ